jgi:plasmid stabilization system protein ParE
MKHGVRDQALNSSKMPATGLTHLCFPLAHPVFLKEIRRTILRRFPYGVYYIVEDDRIVVLAVLHLKRDTLTLLLRRSR